MFIDIYFDGKKTKSTKAISIKLNKKENTFTNVMWYFPFHHVFFFHYTIGTFSNCLECRPLCSVNNSESEVFIVMLLMLIVEKNILVTLFVSVCILIIIYMPMTIDWLWILIRTYAANVYISMYLFSESSILMKIMTNLRSGIYFFFAIYH